MLGIYDPKLFLTLIESWKFPTKHLFILGDPNRCLMDFLFTFQLEIVWLVFEYVEIEGNSNLLKCGTVLLFLAVESMASWRVSLISVTNVLNSMPSEVTRTCQKHTMSVLISWRLLGADNVLGVINIQRKTLFPPRGTGFLRKDLLLNVLLLLGGGDDWGMCSHLWSHSTYWNATLTSLWVSDACCTEN